MKLSESAVESLLRQGRFQEIVADWSANPASVVKLTSAEHQLAIAEALSRTGRAIAARDIASGLAHRPASPLIRARCEMVLGLVARELGFFEEAIQRLNVSARLAKECGHARHAAAASLAALKLQVERQPREVASAVLQEVRTLVVRAGDPHLTSLLHESVARHEAQIGNLDEARRHLRIATALLIEYPNAWLEQLVAVNEFCIEFSGCNLRRAEERLRHASSLEATSGSLTQIIANNAGHIQVQVGKFVEAETTLTRIARTNVGHVRQGALDGLARLYLAWGKLDDCEATLSSLREVEKSADLVPSFSFRSSLLTRARLLLRQKRWADAADLANIAITESRAVADSSLLATSLFLRGLALVNNGQRKDAAISIVRAVDTGAWTFREHQGVLLQACSQIASDFDRRLSAGWFKRAERVWQVHGNLSAEAEFREFASEVGRPDATKRHSRSQGGVVGLVNSLAGLFDFSYNAELLAYELKDVIQELGCSPNVRLMRQQGKHLATEEQQCSLDLGEGRTETIRLNCEIPDDPIKAILLSDVMRIGRAALALEKSREEERNRAALWPADPVEDQSDAIFLADEMQSLLATVRRIAPTTVPVLITGETGTGKEVLARTIHACSRRARNIFIPFNCASTPKDVLDSQLFGHRRGAFTGAVDNFPGVIRGAAGGTLFLDEIGDASLDVQPKLLRFLDASEVHGIGEAQPHRVDVRVIVATNADVDRLVSEGRFREDLFYRLSIVRLHIPPLRERRVEIPALANHYLRKYAHEYNKGELRLSEDTMEYLVLYKWPGNVRQLSGEMRRLAALAEANAVLMPEHLSREIALSRRTIPASQRALDSTEVVVRLDQPMTAATRHLERAMIQYALRKCGDRMEETAKMLGISRKGLYLKRQRYGIDAPESQEATPSLVASVR